MSYYINSLLIYTDTRFNPVLDQNAKGNLQAVSELLTHYTAVELKERSGPQCLLVKFTLLMCLFTAQRSLTLLGNLTQGKILQGFSVTTLCNTNFSVSVINIMLQKV